MTVMSKWLPRTSLEGEDEDGETVTNEALIEWEKIHGRAAAQPPINIHTQSSKNSKTTAKYGKRSSNISSTSSSSSATSRRITRSTKNVSRAMIASNTEYIGATYESSVPQTYREAMESNEFRLSTQAMNAEMKSLQDNNTWSLVARSPHINVVNDDVLNDYFEQSLHFSCSIEHGFK
jgi:hypothetical protein